MYSIITIGGNYENKEGQKITFWTALFVLIGNIILAIYQCLNHDFEVIDVLMIPILMGLVADSIEKKVK